MSSGGEMRSSGSEMRIGISCYPSVGGSGIIATLLGKELAVRGHEVHFISYDRPFRLPKDAPRIKFHQVRVNDYGLFKYPDYTLPLSVKMAEVCREYRLHVLHVHYAVPHATAALLSRCMLPAELHPRIVTTLHGTDTTLLGHDPGYGPAIHHALSQSNGVTAVSQFLKSETRRVLNYDCPIEVVYNFFKPRLPERSRQEVRQDLGISDEEVLIIHSSNLRPVKRIDLLLDTVARVNPSYPFKLLIVAGASFAEFLDQAKRLGLSERIIVRENVLEIEDYLLAADLGLITSDSESFCMSILEAMFFEVPSVATNVGGIPEVIEDGVSGLLAPSGNAAELAGALEKLIAAPDLRRRLGRAAKVRAQELFSAERIVSQYESLYRSVSAEVIPCS